MPFTRNCTELIAAPLGAVALAFTITELETTALTAGAVMATAGGASLPEPEPEPPPEEEDDPVRGVISHFGLESWNEFVPVRQPIELRTLV